MVARAELDLALKREFEQQPSAAAGRTSTQEPPSLTEYVLDWAERKQARWKASYQEHVADVLGLHVLPVLGSTRVTDITRASVEDWVVHVEGLTSRYDRPYAKDTLHAWWRVLRGMLRDMAAEYQLPDPTYRVRPPDSTVRGVRTKQTLTAEQLGKLVNAIKAGYSDWYLEVLLLAFTGMRPGELYALTWDDLDTERRCLHLRRSVWKDQVGTTKTDSPREVALTEEMAELLSQHRQRLIKEQHRGLALGLIFPSKAGKHRLPNSVRKVLRLAAKGAGIPIRVGPQVLRRTFNTLLLEAGVDRVVLRSQMGHSSEQMTARYAGVHVEEKLRAVNRLRALTKGRC